MNRTFQLIMSTGIILLTSIATAVAQDEAMPEADSIVTLETISCRNLLQLNDQEKQATIMFFHGYVSGKKSELTADVNALSTVSDKVVYHCIDNPEDTILSVFERYRS